MYRLNHHQRRFHRRLQKVFNQTFYCKASQRRVASEKLVSLNIHHIAVHKIQANLVNCLRFVRFYENNKLVGRQLASAINSFATNEIKLFMAPLYTGYHSPRTSIGSNCFRVSRWCELFTWNSAAENNSVVVAAAMGYRDLNRIFYLVKTDKLFFARQRRQQYKNQIRNISHSAVSLWWNHQQRNW